MLRGSLLKEIALEAGFDCIGVTGPEPFEDVLEVIKKRGPGVFCPAKDRYSARERCDPRAVFPGVRAIISLGVGYYVDDTLDTIKKSGYVGTISRAASGRDYHRVLREKMEKFIFLLKREHAGSLDYRAFVDTGPLVERAVAQRAGLGTIGKNCSLITPEFGSWVFLGEILVNFPLERQRAERAGDCGECCLCMEACPAGALTSAYQINSERCISYLTQKKGFIPRALRSLVGSRLYGCDTCQEVCPRNEGVKISGRTEFSSRPDGRMRDIEDILTMDTETYNRVWGHTSAGWRGKKIIQRNAVVVLGNYADPGTLPLLEIAAADTSPVVRGHAVWALGRIPGTKALKLLEKIRRRERDPRVLEEFKELKI